jgi:predicted Holliday junction resolvase-like endonuclease
MIGWIVSLILFICLIILYFYFKSEVRKWKINFENRVADELEKREKGIREDAIKRSTSVRVGKEIERLVPFFAEFQYNPRDIRWLGDPVDFVIFNGYSEAKDVGDLNKLNEIVICEIKTGKSRASKYERRIKELIEDRRIKWDEFRVEEYD